jgi:hypothetical protein
MMRWPGWTAVIIELGFAFLCETYFNASSYSVSAQKLFQSIKELILIFFKYIGTSGLGKLFNIQRDICLVY